MLRTLHKKAKKRGVASKVSGRYGKRLLLGKPGERNVRLRNWRGETIKEDIGFVLVLTDEEDADEYVRY